MECGSVVVGGNGSALWLVIWVSVTSAVKLLVELVVSIFCGGKGWVGGGVGSGITMLGSKLWKTIKCSPQGGMSLPRSGGGVTPRANP